MWDTIVINPMVNALLLFYDLLFNNFVLAIAVLTIVIRLITLPLNLRQQKTSLKMPDYAASQPAPAEDQLEDAEHAA